MRSRAKGPSAGSTDGSDRGAPAYAKLLLLAVAALATLAFAASSASAAPPVVKLGPVANVGYTTAEVSGEVNAEGFAVYHFEYSTDGANWTKDTEDIQSIESTELKPVGPFVFTGLKPSTKYFVRLSANNFGDPEVFSEELEFTTLGPIPAPTVTIDPVSTFTDTTAHFSGEIDPGAANSDPGFNVSWRFECEPACSSLSNGSGKFGDDGNKHTLETDASIEPNTAYTIKLVAENVGGSDTAQTTFNSQAPAPSVDTIPPFALGNGTEALIGGKVNPKNQPTKYWLEYGPGPGGPGSTYPSSIPADHEASAGSGAQFVFGTQKINGLTPASTYHFRIVAENATGESQGEDVSFETPPPAEPIQSGCPNEKLRSETSSEQLGECRAYEMTTPPDKNGGDIATVLASAFGGNRLGYMSRVGFSDTPANNFYNSYLAQRSSTGWVSRAMMPPKGAPNWGAEGAFSPAVFSSDLSRAIVTTRVGAASEPGNRNIFSVDADGSTTWVTAPSVPTNPTQIAEKLYAGSSADGSRIFFTSIQSFYGQGVGQQQVWEWFNGQVRLVSILPGNASPGTVTPSPGASLGSWGFTGIQPGAVSEDGSRVFFGTTGTVFVRENASVTRRLDLSQRAGSVGQPPESSQFEGAAADGSIAVFGSTDELTDDATVNGGLYAYNLETEQLRFLSAGATDPAGAQVEGRVTQVSEDGSHVYFVARSVLVPGKGVQGGHNLYVAGPDGVRYIATLGDDDKTIWAPEFRPTTQVTPDGRHFVFFSYERLTAFDNAGHREVYLYNADDGSTTCVSCGNEDEPASGDASIVPYPVARGNQEILYSSYGRQDAISSDGSRVLFETTEALVPGDVNGREDVYIYRDGRVSLISTGTSEYDAEIGAITPDGANAFFLTRDSLVGQDIDGGGADVYDARVDGGFPAPTLANPCESADSCQGAAGPPPGFTSPASTAPGRGNPKPKPRTHCKHEKKKRSKCGSKRHHKNDRRHASKTGRAK